MRWCIHCWFHKSFHVAWWHVCWFIPLRITRSTKILFVDIVAALDVRTSDESSHVNRRRKKDCQSNALSLSICQRCQRITADRSTISSERTVGTSRWLTSFVITQRWKAHLKPVPRSPADSSSPDCFLGILVCTCHDVTKGESCVGRDLRLLMHCNQSAGFFSNVKGKKKIATGLSGLFELFISRYWHRSKCHLNPNKNVTC